MTKMMHMWDSLTIHKAAWWTWSATHHCCLNAVCRMWVVCQAGANEKEDKEDEDQNGNDV